MLVIKTGMSVEQKIAQYYADPSVMILTGLYTADDLEKAVPQNCTAILSFGVCGGLTISAQIGQAFIYWGVVTPTMTYYSDPDWRKRFFGATNYMERRCWSSGNFNTANTVAQRQALFQNTSCWIIDDESMAIAQFAANRKIPFCGLRTVSDGAQDNLPPAVINALNPNGSDNVLDVIESLWEEPIDPVTHQWQLPELVKTAMNAKKSYDELDTACIAVGRKFQWND